MSPTEHIRGWLDERFGWDELMEFARHKTVPLHRYSYWYYLGGITLFLFSLQVVTGILLLLYYKPTPDTLLYASASRGFKAGGFNGRVNSNGEITVTVNGVPVRVKDVGDVVLGPDIRRGIADWNGTGDVVAGIVALVNQRLASSGVPSEMICP